MSKGRIMSANNKLLFLSLLIALFILSWAPRSKASEQILATVTTDIDSDYYKLIVDTSDETQTLKTFFIDNFSNSKLTKRDSLEIKSFIKEGIVFNKKGKRTFAKITPENFDVEQGGMITIDILYNIITGKRRSYELHLAKDKESWKLFSHGKIINKILAHANKVPLIGVVGAKELVMR